MSFARSDAPAVARLRAAGAIPIGVTNTSELCMWMESNNRVYGRTNNPYDRRRIVGGSSGGEGAIVGAGGSRRSASARTSAARSGCRRSSTASSATSRRRAWFPTAASTPTPAGESARLLTSGPLARRAEDLEPFLRVVTGGAHPDDPCSRDVALGDPAAVDLAR